MQFTFDEEFGELSQRDLEYIQVLEESFVVQVPKEDHSARIAEIFTDGSCLGNPGPGGWAALIRIRKEVDRSILFEKTISGRLGNTTNNQMELESAIRALEYLDESLQVVKSAQVTTDSNYVKKGITDWIVKWKRNNWKNSAKKPVKNKEHWVRLDTALRGKEVSWNWVKGHSGFAENEIVDQLARKEASSFAKGAFNI